MSVEVMHARPQCVICAADLNARARKCTNCGAYQDGVECETCGLTMPRGARQCPSCKSLRRGKPCRACGETIAADARRCGACGTWQTIRRFVPASEVTLALILSLVSVIGATIIPIVNYFGNRSNTYIRIIGGESYRPPDAKLSEDTIRVMVANPGKRQSVIKSARISFDAGIDAVSTPLTVMNADKIVVKPGDENYVNLTAPAVSRLGNKTKEQVIAELQARRFATITLVIAETKWNDDVEDVPRTDRIEVIQIIDWMRSHVSSS